MEDKKQIEEENKKALELERKARDMLGGTANYYPPNEPGYGNYIEPKENSKNLEEQGGLH